VEGSKKKRDFVSLVALFCIALFGLLIRVSGQIGNSFPLNDGGLFYSMILDIQNAGFALPIYTTYNGGVIPFVYPPLGFYLAGISSTVFRIPVLALMQWLPALISSLTIIAFYFLADEILKSKSQTFLATLLFAFTPAGFAWIIMGGGITRSWGYLFALLAIRQIYRFYAEKENNIFLVIIFSTLVVLTHPEASIHTALAAAFLFLYYKPNRDKIFQSLKIALGVLLLSSPWWITILVRHGFSPFSAALLSAQQDNVNLFERIFLLFKFTFTEEPNLTIIAALGLLGLFSLLNQKRYLIPLWLVTIFLLEPRSASIYIVFLLSMSAAIFLDEILLVAFNTQTSKETAPFPAPQNWAEEMLNSKMSLALVGFLFVYGIFSAYTTIWNIRQTWSLSADDLEAFHWVAENTSAESSFLVLTSANAMLDPVSEWFPAIAERVSLASVFGYEWVPDGRFGERVSDYVKLQECFDDGILCLENWADENGETYTHIYIARKADSPLGQELQKSPSYDLIYELEEIQIFEKRSIK